MQDPETLKPTYSLHCRSFLGLPFRILSIELVKPKKGTTMETIGRVDLSLCFEWLVVPMFGALQG